jgi:hypothetical protein
LLPPDEPEEPDEPGGEPEEPGVPFDPGEPEVPDEPDDPDMPPDDPELPGEFEALRPLPGDPDVPEDPDMPPDDPELPPVPVPGELGVLRPPLDDPDDPDMPPDEPELPGELGLLRPLLDRPSLGDELGSFFGLPLLDESLGEPLMPPLPLPGEPEVFLSRSAMISSLIPCGRPPEPGRRLPAKAPEVPDVFA